MFLLENKIRLFIAIFILCLLEIVLGGVSALDPTKSFLFVIVLFATIFIIAAPQFGYLFIVFLLPFQNDMFSLIQIGGTQLRLFELVSLPFFMAWIFHAVFLHHEKPFSASGIDFPILIFTAWGILSIVWCVSIGGYLSKIIQLFFGILFFYSAQYWLNSQQRIRQVLWTWVIIGFLAALIAIAEYSFLGLQRACSIDTEAINFAEHLNYPILLLFILLKLHHNKITQFVLIFFLFVMLAGHIATGGRAAFFSLSAGIVFFIFNTFSISKLIIRLVPIFIVGIVVLFTTDVAELLLNRFLNVFESGTSDPGARFRIYVWGIVLSLIWQKNPLCGLGFGSLERMLPALTTRSEKVSVIAQNLYLEIFAALGIIGVIIFLWFVARMIFVIWQTLKRNLDPQWRIIIIGLSSILIAKSTSFTYGVFVEDEFLWVSLGLTFAALKTAIRENNDNTGNSTALDNMEGI